MLNPETKCIIGNGLVIHLRGLMQEMADLKAGGVKNINERLFISDRAHIVFDFHQQLDGLNEKRLGGNKIGTTHKGIGPAYQSKAMRNGIRVGDLKDFDFFVKRLRLLVAQLKQANPDLVVDVDKEIEYYKSIRDEIVAMTTDTITLSNTVLAEGKNILIEGANATSK